MARLDALTTKMIRSSRSVPVLCPPLSLIEAQHESSQIVPTFSQGTKGKCLLSFSCSCQRSGVMAKIGRGRSSHHLCSLHCFCYPNTSPLKISSRFLHRWSVPSTLISRNFIFFMVMGLNEKASCFVPLPCTTSVLAPSLNYPLWLLPCPSASR